jgi:SAM-dependent methyltransferase
MADHDYAAMKEGTRTLWTRGDYSHIARILLPVSQRLVDACAVSAGQEVLDVAAGTGNFAISAANEGARVVASDLTPALIEMGKLRAEQEGVDIEWVEADAEDLPFEDERFDCAASVFGAMFAPRPELAAKELFRVVRPGNTVGMANWCPDGFSGRFFGIWAQFLPAPEGVPAPIEWGVEENVEKRFEGLAGSLDIERTDVHWTFPDFDGFLQTFEHAGPHDAAREAMGPEGYAAAVEKIRALVEEFNQAEDGSVDIHSDYLLVVARKRG